MLRPIFWLPTLAITLSQITPCPIHFAGVTTTAAEPRSDSGDASEASEVLAGHSYHGEAFNAGPRQAAVLMPGMAAIQFPTSTKSELAQQFFEQGVAQLHGFLYLEAERSFRQAAKEDPELAIAYWGMAMSNENNSERARGFIDDAMERIGGRTTRREKLYIEALNRFIEKPADDEGQEEKNEEDQDKSESSDGQDSAKKKEAETKDQKREAKIKRAQRYFADLEKILHEFPDDIEAKAFLVVEMWKANRYGVKLTSNYAVDALLGQIFAANPMHPAHHYRIHLWDSPHPENALQSAANCGPSSPGIAHMWHMPGHIYSKLKRYNDAAWQQEASARVDHAHMIQTRLMPDQIHNFAHNNEWLVRNLLLVGRVEDALDLSRNLISLPRHPAYNTLSKRGSYKYGHMRLIQTLSQYGLWEELKQAAAAQQQALIDDEQRDEWTSWQAAAQFITGQRREGRATLRSLQRQRLDLQRQRLDLAEAQDKSSDQATEPAADTDPVEDRNQLDERIAGLKTAIARAAAAAAVVRRDPKAFKEHAKTAKLDVLIQARWLADAGAVGEAIKLLEPEVKKRPGEVLPLATLVDLLWRDDQRKRAQESFAKLRTVAGHADPDTPLLARLAPVAKAADVKGDWRTPKEPADDLGERPSLDSLGPFRWRPYQAPAWQALTPQGKPVSPSDFGNRPKVLIFYLGFGCLHCVEQLHEFAPLAERFDQAGIDLVGISTESVEDLQTGIEAFDEPLAIPLVSDPESKTFHAFRCWDDFENQPLHGTFLVDAEGRVRWQDISYEPFTDAEFLLEEAERLLQIPPPGAPSGAIVTTRE
ncbi:redoxin domain-containing protein [Roseiconus nitratireducens]|uniref:Redoxin domain-containing protein n=1 Tax=Roseiconus nitratireducens TaxID=2605748 RepID=A0A5M6DD07_9BACT|nr:peroxiredoxin family protein [Roseiconus nitratireducens]KAA5543055.1 redoxin domain-containing protein [Roseiconus nitratireducens]